MFKKMLKEIDSSFVGVKTFNLKKKLRSKYPQLEFARPSLRNLSEIVYASHKATSLADQWDSEESGESVNRTNTE